MHIPTVKQQYGLSEAWLSLLLLTVALGAVLSLLVAGRVIARLGVRRATRLAAILITIIAVVLLGELASNYVKRIFHV